MARWRVALGVAILALLVGFCALLFQPYARNYRLQTYIEKLAFDPELAQKPAEMFAISVVDYAGRLGLPLKTEQVKVATSPTGVFIEARYFVRVDLLVYTVDLHFRPAAGSR